jgi:hypothetical protein
MPNPAFVQTAHGSGPAATTQTVTFGSNTAAGNLIFVACFGGVVPVTIADSQGNYWSQVDITRTSVGARSLSVFYAYATIGGADTITVTSNGVDFIDLIACEYSNVQTVIDPLDAESTAIGSGTALSSGNATTSAPNDLTVDALDAGGGGISVTDGSNVRASFAASSFVVSDQDVASPSTVAATATATTGGWVAQLAAFLALVSIAPPTSPAYVQSNVTTTSSTVSTLASTFTTPQIAGDTIVVFVVGTAVTSVTDTSGNTYVPAGVANNGSGPVVTSGFYALNVKAAAAGANTVTANFASVNSPQLFIAEYKRASVFVGAFTNTGNSAAPSVSFSLAANSNGQMVAAVAGFSGGAPTVTPGAGYRQRVIDSFNDILEDNLKPPVGPNTAAESLSASVQWAMVAIVFGATQSPQVAGTLLGGVIG